jgi:hypothetical protein
MGYERHDVLHMLASTMSDELWQTLHEKTAYDHARHVRSLRALAESWKQLR